MNFSLPLIFNLSKKIFYDLLLLFLFIYYFSLCFLIIVCFTILVFQLQGGINVFTQGSGTPPPSYIPPPTAMPTTTSNSLSNYPITSQPQIQQQRQSPAYPVQVPSKMGGLTTGTTGLNPYPTLPSTSTSSTYSNIKSGKQSDLSLNSNSTSPVPFTSQSLSQGVSQTNQISSSTIIAASNYQNVPSYQPSYDCPATSHQFHPNLNSNTNSNTNTNGNGKEYQYQNNTDFGSKNPSPNNAYNHNLPLPEIPTEFREIRNLTTFQLEKLSKDEVAIQVNKKIYHQISNYRK